MRPILKSQPLFKAQQLLDFGVFLKSSRSEDEAYSSAGKERNTLIAFMPVEII